MKTAVHLHLYYFEQLPWILSLLHNLNKADVAFDLYVTISVDDLSAKKQILNEFPTAVIWQIENRGYDVAPFIDFLHKINLDDYDYILKIHTKNRGKTYTMLNGRYLNNALWCDVLFDALLKDPERIKQNYAFLDENQNVGMLGSAYCLAAKERYYKKLFPRIKQEMAKLNLSMPPKIAFVAGTMFIARAAVLKPFLQVSFNDFEVTNRKSRDDSKAHVYERLFEAVVLAQGKKVEGIKQEGFLKAFISTGIRRFLYQEKNTKSGKIIVKICRIPIYVKKLIDV